MPAGGRVPRSQLPALGEPGESRAIDSVVTERGSSAAQQRRQEGQPGGPDDLHRALCVKAEGGADRACRQVVGVAQQQGRALAFGSGLEGLGEPQLVGVGGQHATADGQVVLGTTGSRASQVPGSGEPPADGIADGVGLAGHRVDKVDGAALDDQHRCLRCAPQPPDGVVDAVGVHPHRGEHLVSREHVTTLGRCVSRCATTPVTGRASSRPAAGGRDRLRPAPPGRRRTAPAARRRGPPWGLGGHRR